MGSPPLRGGARLAEKAEAEYPSGMKGEVNAPEGRFRFADPKTIEERRELAGQCQTALLEHVPTLVDEMDDAVMTAYAAWPDRLYLVVLDGRVAYAGGRGPFGFKPAELKAAIDRHLAGL
jgi:hypothetical protein